MMKQKVNEWWIIIHYWKFNPLFRYSNFDLNSKFFFKFYQFFEKLNNFLFMYISIILINKVEKNNLFIT